MLATLRETLSSLGDLGFGRVIVTRTTGQALWYWTKYVLFVAGLVWAVVAGMLAYYAPQLPRLLTQYLPQLELTVSGGRVTSQTAQPFVWGDRDFALVVDTAGKVADLDPYQAGALILADRIVAKAADGQIRVYQLKDTDNFSFAKEKVVDWVSRYRGLILTAGLLVAAAAVALGGAVYWLFQLLSLVVWAALFWLVARLLKRSVTYMDGLKMATYAAVLPLLFGVVGVFAPSRFFPWLALALFLFFGLAWIKYLPAKSE